MGFLADLTDTKALKEEGFRGNTAKLEGFPGAERSQNLWREVFQTAGKEDTKKPVSRLVPGGSWGRSLVGGDPAQKRLLQALRSMAPGGWSDNRFEETRHWEGIAYIAGHRICEQLSQAEFQIFRKDDTHPDGKVAVKKGEEGWDLVELLEKPNPDDSFGDLMYQWGQQLTLTGMALTWMVPNMLESKNPAKKYEGAGTPYELYSIPTALAIPQPAVNPDFPDGYYRVQPLYPYGPFSSYPTPATAVGAPIPAQWMLRVKYPNPLLRYDGFSPLTALRLHLDEVTMMDRSRHYSMRRSINPSAVINFDEVEGQEPLREEEIERIHAEWENEFQGPENSGKIIVGTPGGRIENWGTSPKDMDYQSGWDQLVSFCLGGLGITKPAAGMIDDASYSTLFATLKQLYWLTLEPLVNRIAAKLTRHLAPFFGEDLIVEIRCRRIDDHDVRNAEVGVGIQAMCITKNEVRKKLDLPPTKEKWGNEIAGIPTQPEAPPMQAGMGQEQMTPEMMAQMEQEGQLQEGGVQGAPPEQDPDMEQGRPQAGNLAAGALGPRMKSLNGKKKAHNPRMGEYVDAFGGRRLTNDPLNDKEADRFSGHVTDVLGPGFYGDNRYEITDAAGETEVADEREIHKGKSIKDFLSKYEKRKKGLNSFGRNSMPVEVTKEPPEIYEEDDQPEIYTKSLYERVSEVCSNGH